MFWKLSCSHLTVDRSISFEPEFPTTSCREQLLCVLGCSGSLGTLRYRCVWSYTRHAPLVGSSCYMLSTWVFGPPSHKTRKHICMQICVQTLWCCLQCCVNTAVGNNVFHFLQVFVSTSASCVNWAWGSLGTQRYGYVGSVMYLLSGAAALAHRLEGAVPVQQLEDGHQLLELQHRPPLVRLQHEAEGADTRVRVVHFLLTVLKQPEEQTE